MQIPHITPDLLRKLSRKKVKVLSDLTTMKTSDRLVTLTDCGLTNQQVEDVEVALSAMPSVTVTSVAMMVEGLQVCAVWGVCVGWGVGGGGGMVYVMCVCVLCSFL